MHIALLLYDYETEFRAIVGHIRFDNKVEMLARSARECTPLLAYLNVSSALLEKITEREQENETSDDKTETLDSKDEVSKPEKET